MASKISFINFWNGFEPLFYFNFLFELAGKNGFSLSIDEYNPDIVIGSVFGDIEKILKHKSKIKILYTAESLENRPEYQKNIKEFDYVVGLLDKNQYSNCFEIPLYYQFIKYRDLYFKIEQDFQYEVCQNLKVKKSKEYTLISTNPHSLRIRILNILKEKDKIVDCPSVVGNNINTNIPTRCDKIEFLKDYVFHICPENSWCSKYTTEKLFDCCLSGCIPIYWGCDKLNDGFYNQERILFIDKNLSNIESVLDHSLYLLNNKKKLLDFLKQNPFNKNLDNFLEKVENNVITFLNKIC